MMEPLRPASSVLVEAHDEWQVADKRHLSETTLALLNPLRSPTTNPLQSQPQSRHSENPQSLRRNARSTYSTPRGPVGNSSGPMTKIEPAFSAWESRSPVRTVACEPHRQSPWPKRSFVSTAVREPK